jgi:acyl-CoA synthetase (NDP forming)
VSGEILNDAVNVQGLGALVDPRSIAVIGASADAARIGGRTIYFLQRHGYAGTIYPVTHRQGDVQGLTSYPDIASVPEAPDLAVISIPAAQVLEQLERCAARGVKAAIVFSAGFSEIGAEGEAEQDRITALAARTGLRVLGPNCLGVMSIGSKVHCTFSAAPNFDLPEPGGVSIVSQSGAFGTYTFMAGNMRGLPMNHWITTGNEADIDFADCVAWLAGDPGTQVIMGYMEGCRNGRKLMRALEMARAAKKPVVVMKVGRTEAGAAAARSHTAALAGSDEVFDAVFRQFGVHRASTVDEFFDVGYACLRGLRPTSARLGIMTGSGGAGVLMADAAEEAGLEISPMPQIAQDHMRALVPFAGTQNPVDVTGQAANDPSLFTRFLDIMVREGEFGAIATFQALGGLFPSAQETLVAHWRQVREQYPATSFFVATMSTPDVRRAMEALHIPVFDEPTRMVRAIAALHRFERSWAGEPQPVHQGPRRALSPAAMTEADASAILKQAGVPMALFHVAKDRQEARDAASRFGFPVVMKVVSPDIAHKTDVGGVMLNLTDEDAVEAAFDAINQKVRAACPDATITGVLVAPMIRGGIEAIIGATDDPTFGPVVMVGLGGTLVEVLKDVSFRAAPFSRTEALAMIGALKGANLLDGVRGQPPADRDALADALVALGDFAAAHAGSFDSIEINPLIVRAAGMSVVGLDALIA